VLGLLRRDEPEDHRRVSLSCLAKKGRGFSEDLALLGEDPVLAAQPAQLLALVPDQALGLALVNAKLARPVPQ
jgi:hypothetical protein